jgi:hypothetical protein
MTEVVTTKDISRATTATYFGRDTDIGKTFIHVTTIGDTQIHSANQTGLTLRIRITISLTFDTRTACLTEIQIAKRSAGATAAGTGCTATVGRFVTALTGRTRITSMLASTRIACVSSVAEETIVARACQVRMQTIYCSKKRYALVIGTGITVITVTVIQTHPTFVVRFVTVRSIRIIDAAWFGGWYTTSTIAGFNSITPEAVITVGIGCTIDHGWWIDTQYVTSV